MKENAKAVTEKDTYTKEAWRHLLEMYTRIFGKNEKGTFIRGLLSIATSTKKPSGSTFGLPLQVRRRIKPNKDDVHELWFYHDEEAKWFRLCCGAGDPIDDEPPSVNIVRLKVDRTPDDQPPGVFIDNIVVTGKATAKHPTRVNIGTETYTEIHRLTNEFTTDLKLQNWDDHDPKWVGRYPSWFEPSNLSIVDNKLHMTCRVANDTDTLPSIPKGQTTPYTHAACAYRSKEPVLYGYFEVKAKTIGGKWWNSFWLYNETDQLRTEIDIYEIVGSEHYRFHTAHRFWDKPDYIGTVEDHYKKQQEFFNVTDVMDWHVYGLDWDQDNISWYVDGVQVYTTPNDYWHQPLHLMLDAEVSSWPGTPTADDNGVYEVEYIRAWKKTT